jgi:hypothetical protein
MSQIIGAFASLAVSKKVLMPWRSGRNPLARVGQAVCGLKCLSFSARIERIVPDAPTLQRRLMLGSFPLAMSGSMTRQVAPETPRTTAGRADFDSAFIFECRL